MVGMVSVCVGTCLWIPLSLGVGLVKKCRGKGEDSRAEDTVWIRDLKEGICI